MTPKEKNGLSEQFTQAWQVKTLLDQLSGLERQFRLASAQNMSTKAFRVRGDIQQEQLHLISIAIEIVEYQNFQDKKIALLEARLAKLEDEDRVHTLEGKKPMASPSSLTGPK